MYPLEDAIAKLGELPPVLYAGVAAGAYLSCRSQCDLDCPMPGKRAPRRDDMPELAEIANVDPTDMRFVQQLYQRGRGQRKGSSFANALSDMFRIV